jgi:hypothetical protein
VQERTRLSRPDLWDLLAVALVGGLVWLAAVVGRRLEQGVDQIHAGAPPLQGQWLPRWSAPAMLAVLVALLVVAYGPGVAATLRWRFLPWLTWLTATIWVVAVASVDPWHEAFADRLSSKYDYLAAVPQVSGWSDLLSGFADRIPGDVADRWPTHVAGHPPGILAPFVGLDRLGLDGPGPAAVLLVLVGASAAAASVVAARALVDEDAGRRMAPFAALMPGAVWVGVSGDALILGISAWGVALVALACARGGWPLAAAGGLVLGVSLYLSYGMVLVLGIAAVVLVTRGTWRLVGATASGLVLVVAVVTVAGFNWYDGYQLVVVRYADGLGGVRLYSYWVWANLAAFALAVGPAAVVGVRRALAGLRLTSVVPSPLWRLGWVRDRHNTLAIVAASGLGAALIATLGGLSKGEVERIWLPFGVWVLLAVVAIPVRRARWWLAAQAAVVLGVQWLVLTPW